MNRANVIRPFFRIRSRISSSTAERSVIFQNLEDSPTHNQAQQQQPRVAIPRDYDSILAKGGTVAIRVFPFVGANNYSSLPVPTVASSQINHLKRNATATGKAGRRAFFSTCIISTNPFCLRRRGKPPPIPDSTEFLLGGTCHGHSDQARWTRWHSGFRF